LPICSRSASRPPETFLTTEEQGLVVFQEQEIDLWHVVAPAWI